ncbi:MAG: DinB family protein [Planctomycetes bacterium]|nr:DinB family protein [Planctomycetota bacterium]
MTIASSLLPELDHEMASTRKLLDRLPETKLSWKPHPKSMSLGQLATHIAEIPGWAKAITAADSFDLAPPGGRAYAPPVDATRGDVLRRFDGNVREAQAAIAVLDDAAAMRPWSLLKGGHAFFTLPKVAVLRSMLFGHAIHHRGQLTVYLRLLDVPVPSVYGPTADEPM